MINSFVKHAFICASFPSSNSFISDLLSLTPGEKLLKYCAFENSFQKGIISFVSCSRGREQKVEWGLSEVTGPDD